VLTQQLDINISKPCLREILVTFRTAICASQSECFRQSAAGNVQSLCYRPVWFRVIAPGSLFVAAQEQGGQEE
jgi:hypothetical protein